MGGLAIDRIGIKANEEYPIKITSKHVIEMLMNERLAFFDLNIKKRDVPISISHSHMLSPMNSTPDNIRLNRKVNLTRRVFGLSDIVSTMLQTIDPTKAIR